MLGRSEEVTMPTSASTSTDAVPSAAPHDGDTAGVRALVEAAVRHQSDVEPFLALHADDAVIVNIAGRRVLGAAALGEAMRGALVSPLADVTTTVDVEDVRFLRDDVALVSCTKHVHDGRGDGTALPTSGAMSYVVTRGRDGWRIALAQTTPVGR